MTPTAKDIVESPTWQAMQDRMNVAMYGRFMRTPVNDLEALRSLRMFGDVLLDVIRELELMAREES